MAFSLNRSYPKAGARGNWRREEDGGVVHPCETGHLSQMYILGNRDEGGQPGLDTVKLTLLDESGGPNLGHGEPLILH